MSVPRAAGSDVQWPYHARMKEGRPRVDLLADHAVVVIALFWAAQYAIVTTVDHLVADTAFLFLPRILISGSGLILSLAISQLRRLVPSAAVGRLIALI